MVCSLARYLGARSHAELVLRYCPTAICARCVEAARVRCDQEVSTQAQTLLRLVRSFGCVVEPAGRLDASLRPDAEISLDAYSSMLSSSVRELTSNSLWELARAILSEEQIFLVRSGRMILRIHGSLLVLAAELPLD
jgi:hypothetical protein